MKFVVYVDKASEYRWKLVARNNRIVADSGQGYKKRHTAWNAILKWKSRVMDADIKEVVK